MDNGPTLAFIKDEAGRFVYVNRRFLERFGLQPGDVIGWTEYDLWPREVAEKFYASDAGVLAANETVTFVETLPAAHGGVSYWQVYKFPLEEAGGRRLLGGMAVDITLQRQTEEKLRAANALLENLAVTDPLTGLRNRRAFSARLDEEVRRARRTNDPLSLVIADVDQFKSYNDSFGHPAGDEVLQTLARLLESTCRPTDFVARHGGEEFVILLPDTDQAGALVAAERCRGAIGLFHWPHRAVRASFGTATLQNAQTADGLIARADRALYHAKHTGRDRVVSAADVPEEEEP